jgi:hypothetical protein
MNPSAISPEITAKQSKTGSIVQRLWKYLAVSMEHRREFQKALPSADQRSFDWDWKKINYNRIALVNLLLSKFDDPKYLEIGCASNSLFDSVPVRQKTGVDPSSGGNVRKTSDQFFESSTENFDVVFIDGLHTYEQIRVDINNALKRVNRPSWIVMHDMLPRNWIEQHIPVVTRRAWTGNVWKVAFELVATPGIDFRILRIDHGVGVIKVTGESAPLVDLSATLNHEHFSFYYDNFAKLPVVEWSAAQEWLRS